MDNDGRHDFDFLAGSWTVRHHRLKERLQNCTEWDECDGTCRAFPLMDGTAIGDDNVIELETGIYRAITSRTFDPSTRRWAIWWIDGRNPHTIDPPVFGRFENDVGTFYGEDTFHGTPIRVRFEWSHITPTSARWEQAFSRDNGATWETNWRMDFTRVPSE